MPIFRFDARQNGVVYDGQDGPLLFLPNNISTGTVFYLDPVNGSDNNNTGLSPASAVKTLAEGYGLLREGRNDVLVLIGNGLSSGSARLSAGFTWSKNAAHLLGVCSSVTVGKRARIAPTAAVAAFANFFTVSGSGCLFKNLQLYHGFATGIANSICLTVSGGRNLFEDMDIHGMGDTESAADTGSRSLLVKTTGENTFRRSTIGLDTVIRSVANYTVQFLGTGANSLPRNTFQTCLFPQWSSSAQAAAIYVLGANPAGIDRFQIFDDCIFFNDPNAAGYLASTGVVRLGAAQNGIILIRHSTCVGFTGWGYNATSRNGILIDGGAPAGNTTISETGIAVVPTA